MLSLFRAYVFFKREDADSSLKKVETSLRIRNQLENSFPVQHFLVTFIIVFQGFWG